MGRRWKQSHREMRLKQRISVHCQITTRTSQTSKISKSFDRIQSLYPYSQSYFNHSRSPFSQYSSRCLLADASGQRLHNNSGIRSAGINQLLLNVSMLKRPTYKFNLNLAKKTMESPSRTSIDMESYHTPVCAQNAFKVIEMFSSSRVFLSHKKKYRKTPSTYQHTVEKLNKEEQHNQMPKSQKADLLVLAEWLRWAAVSIGVGKHVFNNALSLLSEGSQKLECTYALAAAALAIATKLEHSTLISRHHQLPAKPANLPKVSIHDAIKVEGILLNTLNFCVPVSDRKIHLLLSLTERWNCYFRRNSRHLKLPLYMIEAGLTGRWQKRNLTCAGYLLDLLFLGAGEHYAEEEILLTAALTTVSAVNCCQAEQISQPNFILAKYAKCFLRRCFNSSEQCLHSLWRILLGIAKNKIWQKLALVPTRQQQKEDLSFQSEEEKLQWLNQLDFIPFSQSTEIIDS